VAQEAVSALYGAVKRIDRQKTAARPKRFFSEWDRLFGAVYGQKLEKAQATAAQTALLYNLPAGADLKPLLFSIHTYYAFLMKLIAVELLALQPDSTMRGFAAEVAYLDDNELRSRLTYLESGHEFSRRGIDNFLEADFFGWYLDLWGPEIARNVREIARCLGEFEAATTVLEPAWTHDLLRNLYEIVVPQKLRHDLGEYYTPDWLARHVIDRAGYTGELQHRFLDPACGSGTFLVHAIHLALDRARRQPAFDSAVTARSIIDSVVGFDLNPMAVLAARTNYLISIADLIPAIRPLSLPVYLCDSVVPLERAPDPGKPLFPEGKLVFSTHVRNYEFPLSMKDKARIDRFTGLVDESLRAASEPAVFASRVRTDMRLPDAEAWELAEVYRQIKALHDANEDGIWARYIKNAFAPVYVGAFDYVVGNPPWIRWKFLSDEYRQRTLPLWHQYRIFSLRGQEARLGAGEKDFSMLFTYACADRYLKDGGTLAFLITETVFKARGGGEGFRSFEIPATMTPLSVLWMEDMVSLNPFLTASNKTCAFALRRGESTSYPVPVTRWRTKKGVGRIPPSWSAEQVLSKTERDSLQAVPVEPHRAQSSWQIASGADLRRFEKMKGANAYPARRGADTSPYGVFRLRLKEVVRSTGIVGQCESGMLGHS